MLRSIIVFFPALLIANLATAQYEYVDMPETVIAKDVQGKPLLRSYFGNQILNTFLNVYDDERKSRESIESTRGKTEILKETFSSIEIFPDSIKSGWHSAVATDQQKFCKDVKVRVENNRVVEFVIDECIRIGCNSIGSIKNGKTTLTLDNFNGEKTELVSVYFLYDLEGDVLIDEPMQPGYVCIWTENSRYVGERIIMNRIVMEGVQYICGSTPDCFDKGTVTMILKPGTYSFLAKKRGSDYDGAFVVVSGKCLKYRLP